MSFPAMVRRVMVAVSIWRGVVRLLAQESTAVSERGGGGGYIPAVLRCRESRLVASRRSSDPYAAQAVRSSDAPPIGDLPAN